jgi:hypothetical protein
VTKHLVYSTPLPPARPYSSERLHPKMMYGDFIVDYRIQALLKCSADAVL